MNQPHWPGRRALPATIIFALLGTSHAGARQDDLPTKIDAIAAEALKNPGAVGLSIAVGIGDEIILADGYGLAEVEHNAPARPDTVFRIGSVTKQFTAAAIMKLVEEGKLQLDEPMTTFFPDYPLNGATVTIRHLLTHTSGIKSYTEVERFWVEGVSRELSVAELLSYVRDEPLEFAPGERYAYNNTAYYMLGPIIEQISGVPYAEYLKTTFFEPLGLKHTRYDSNSDIIPGRAQGYTVANGTISNDRLIGMANPGAAGGLIASAQDLVKWQMALVSDKVVSEESYEQMTTPFTLNDGSSTGYGFGLTMDEFEGHRRVSHGGGIFGFKAMLAYFPDDDVHVAVISNCEAADAGSIAWKVQRAALGIAEPEITDLQIPAELLTRLTGNYFVERFGVRPTVVARDGQLFLQPQEGDEFRLLFQGGEEFRAAFDQSVRFVFVLEEDGAPATSIIIRQSGQEFVVKREDG